MSEAKHTPLPWMKQPAVNQETFKDYVELYRPPGYPNEPIGTLCPYLHDAEANADLILTSVNARPKAKELLEAGRDARAALQLFAHGRGFDTVQASAHKRLDRAIREVEAALGGKAE